MSIIAFITQSADIRRILDYIGAETEPQRITPALGPPLCGEWDAQVGDVKGCGVEPNWDEEVQTASDFEVDPLVSW